MLKLQKVCKNFGGLAATADVSFTVPQGEITALVGPNGSGKTTLFNLISGVYAPDRGEIHLDGRPIHGLKPHQVCHLGIGRTYQVVQPFAGMTVLENVMVGALYGRAGAKRNLGTARTQAFAVLERVGLVAAAAQSASSLTLSGKKRLEVAKALATDPRLLLLDEVMAGLSPAGVDEMVAVVRGLHEQGLTIILVEHVLRAVMKLAQRTIVLHMGAVIAQGEPAVVMRDRRVVESYLGEEYASALHR
jgi:branched-chain amino acid transport system ATP-binding protein